MDIIPMGQWSFVVGQKLKDLYGRYQAYLINPYLYSSYIDKYLLLIQLILINFIYKIEDI